MPVASVVAASSEFVESMRATAAYLRSRGFEVVEVNAKDEDPRNVIPLRGFGYDVAFWFSHGGWDGPLVFGYDPLQIDPVEKPEEWKNFAGWIRKYLRPGGLFVVHACHSAGSNRYETTEGAYGERWVHQLARDMGVYAVGVEGSTASANRFWAVEFARFAIDGSRFPRQPTRMYRPGGQIVSAWRGWLQEQGGVGRAAGGR